MRVWKEYLGGENKRKRGGVSISIGRTGVIRMNREAMKLLGDPEAVLLQFEEEGKVIGMLPSTLRNDHSFTVTKRPSCWTVHAAPFCKHFGIRIDKTERFDEPFVDDEGTLCLDLKRTHITAFAKPRKTARTRQ